MMKHEPARQELRDFLNFLDTAAVIIAIGVTSYMRLIHITDTDILGFI
jgi:hypothetical protein